MDDPKMKLQSSLVTRTLRISCHARLLRTLFLTLIWATLTAPTVVSAQKVNWIWSPKAAEVDGVQAQGDCYFRAKFTLIKPEKAEIIFAAGDEYELYLNNRLVTKGESYGSDNKLDVFSYVQPGVNLVAVKVTHVGSDQPGLAMKVRVKEKDETRWRSLVTNDTWRTRREMITAWTQNGYNDMGWLKAKSLGSALAFGQPAQKSTKPVASTSPTKSTKPVQSPAAESRTSVKASAAKVPAQQVSTTKVVKQPSKPAVPTYIQPKITNGPQAMHDSQAAAAKETAANEAVAKVAAANEAPVKVAEVVQTPAATLPVATEPAANEVAPPAPAVTPVASDDAPSAKPSPRRTRFSLDPEFTIQQVLTAKEAGPMVAMAFDEFGQVVFSRENGPLMIADLGVPAGTPGRVKVYCDKVRNCGGILPVNGSVYVTGDGPAGLALYRLSDSNKSGTLQPAKALFKFSGTAGNHGPHGMRLGPDGMIYMVLGNGSKVDRPVAKTSPYQNTYEGDVIARMDDPAGHATGVDAPGGTIVRCSLDGTRIEIFAGGLRNASDLVFDASGQLFVHDSDHSADRGTPWYRPSMLFHVAAGAELGWRSGSGKFPAHFIDATQPVCETDSGLPAGAVAYRHLQFPARFHDAIFTSNRTTGEILSVQTQRVGASYTGEATRFLKGNDFDVADLSVGEDGSLYIATGSRAGVGGLYRVVWNGEVPDDLLQFESDLAKVIRHPQPDSSWARQNVAQLKITMGQEWNNAIRGVAAEPRNPAKFRIRALQLMVLYGPAIDTATLNKLAGEDEPMLRTAVAQLCGATGDRRNQQVLRQLLADDTPAVRRSAAEAMLKLDIQPDFEAIATLLKSEDRVEAAVARRLLERLPVNQWQEKVLTTDNKRLFIQGAIALSIAKPTLENSYSILARSSEFMDGFISDVDFIDMLRAMQLALVQANVDPAQVPGFVTRIKDEFPSGNAVMNVELARLLGYLKASDFGGRLESYLSNEEVKSSERMAVAMQLPASAKNLERGELLSLLTLLDAARSAKGVGSGYRGYVEGVLAKCNESVSAEHVDAILDQPKMFVSSLIPAFYHVPEQVDADMHQRLVQLDESFAERNDQQSREIRLGIVALMGQSGDKASMRYLRTLWQNEGSRRSDIVIGLAQQPNGENWSYLVSSLPGLDASSAQEVMTQLRTVARKPRDSRHYHELIRIAEQSNDGASQAALSLLQHWSGTSFDDGSGDRAKLVASWKQWCEQQFDSVPAASTAEGGDTDRF